MMWELVILAYCKVTGAHQETDLRKRSNKPADTIFYQQNACIIKVNWCLIKSVITNIAVRSSTVCCVKLHHSCNTTMYSEGIYWGKTKRLDCRRIINILFPLWVTKGLKVHFWLLLPKNCIYSKGFQRLRLMGHPLYLPPCINLGYLSVFDQCCYFHTIQSGRQTKPAWREF